MPKDREQDPSDLSQKRRIIPRLRSRSVAADEERWPPLLRLAVILSGSLIAWGLVLGIACYAWPSTA